MGGIKKPHRFRPGIIDSINEKEGKREKRIAKIREITINEEEKKQKREKRRE